MIREGRVTFSAAHEALRHRPAALAFALLILGSAISYPLDLLMQNHQYSLAPEVEKLVGEVNPNLASKLKLNKEEGIYEFNGGAVEDSPLLGQPDPKAALQSMKQQTGGGDKASQNLYALDVPLDPSKGVSYYDKNLKLSFKATPQFTLSNGRTDDDGRLVYPGARGTKAVYSLKTNGLKEDMVLTRPVGDSFSFSYELDLPKELEARLQDDGSVGIYSADPILFGNVSFGGDQDYEKVKSARESAVKDHLAFAIPAPVIVQQGNKSHTATSKFVLKGNVLTVESRGLEQLTYPISIDPSVVVTSSADFTYGNNEGGIEFATDEIKRGSLTGGINDTWATTTSLSSAREMHRTETYNGYAYIIGGYNGTSPLNTVEYAQINSDGTLGAWQATSSFTNPRSGHSTVAYNGYLYIIGGYQGASVVLNDVQYAKINANGTLGAWQTTSSFTTARQQHTSVAYNGYVYLFGGASSQTVFYNDVQFAAIRADGTLGAWQSTTSFATTRANHASEVYNGYVYVIGGANASSLSTVEFARLNADGTVGPWSTTSSLQVTRNNHGSAIYNGYVYVMGGYTSGGANLATVGYAPINANGSLGSWSYGASFTTARYNSGSFENNGYIYLVGGFNDTSRFADVQYAKIKPAGANASWATTTAIPTIRAQGKDYGAYGNTAVAYNGYLYTVGGYSNAGRATVHYAPFNADGTVGAWTATTSLPAVRYYHASVAYNGYLYVIGGYDTAHRNNIYYAPINANGTVGTWVDDSTNPFTNVRSTLGAIVYNGYLYISGGYGTSFVEYADVQSAPINSDGSIGAFTTLTSFATARDSHYMAVIGDYVYIAGGWNGTTNYNDVQFAKFNSTGGLIGGLSSCPAGGTLTGGTWCTTSSLQTARHAFTGFTRKGCLYAAAGGIAGNAQTASLEYTCANSDGTLKAWSNGSSYATARDYAAGVVHNDFLYSIGGETGGQPSFADVQYSRVNNGGSGAVGAWSTTTAFNTGRQTHSSVIYNGYIYLLGGNDGPTYYNDVQYAPINADGTFGTWATTSSFTTGRYEQSAVAYNGYLYVIAGYGGGNLSDVQYAPINANGTIGAWTATTSLPAARYGHTSFAKNGFLYVIGGYGAVELNDVQYAPINANGTIGAWTATTSFATARYQHSSVVYKGYVYIMGGSGEKSDVQYAPINANGTLGTWTTTSSMAVGRYGHSAAVYNGYIYISGGYGGTAYRNDVQYARINPNGTLSQWNTTQSFTTTRSGTESTAYNGYLYVMGGYTGGTNSFLNDVQYAPLQSIPRKASYSKLIDLGAATTVNSVTTIGTGSLTYRTAGADGILGAQQAAGSTGGVSARYVWVKVSLDDTSEAAGDNVLSSTQDITIDYAAIAAPVCTTAQRLRHGMSFASESLQSLGTCTQ